MKLKVRLTPSLIIPLFFQLLCVLGCSSAVADTVVKTYGADDSVFPNPERGFHNRFDLVPGGETDFSRATNAGNTLIHSYVRLDDFRTSNISQSVLDQLTNTLGAARSQGKKVILRVAYNFGPYPDSLPDADEYWIGQHLNQLSPLLNANKDVIAYMEAGFIGAWGEWHTSTHGLDTDPSAKVRILNNILQNIPASIQIALRYPSDLRAVVNGGVSSSRLGNHQDCFLASEPDDWGTWGRDSAYSVAQDKALIADAGVNHPVGGETCNLDSPRVSCATALAEMQQMHFSEINEDYETGVINLFKTQGCYNTIDQKLGYRFRLIDATYSNSIGVGATATLKVKLVNDGFASPFNTRPLFAVLDGAGGSFSFQLSADPRNWKSGQQVEINESFTLPTSIPAGTYRLSLWLPDNASNLRSDARYSIRFANQNTWDSAKGVNVLATDIQVSNSSTPTGVVNVYKDCKFGGYTAALKEGSYNLAQLNALGVLDNDVSSLKVQAGYQIQVFKDNNSTGASIVKTADDSCLVDDGFNDVISSVVVSKVVSSSWSTQIEAESFVNMSGIQTENCSEGGLNVGWIDTGDWMVWDINLPTTGTYKVEYRVAGLNGGSIQLEKAGGSPVYATINVPNTGGWQSWQTISHTVSLTSGQQQIAIYAPAGGYNINWIKFTKM